MAELNAEQKEGTATKSAAARTGPNSNRQQLGQPRSKTNHPVGANAATRETPQADSADPDGQGCVRAGTSWALPPPTTTPPSSLTGNGLASQGQQGGPAQQLRFITQTYRALGAEKRAGTGHDSVHTEMPDAFEHTLIKLFPVLRATRTGINDALVGNLKSDIALSPQLLALHSGLGSRSESGPDLDTLGRQYRAHLASLGRYPRTGRICARGWRGSIPPWQASPQWLRHSQPQSCRRHVSKHRSCTVDTPAAARPNARAETDGNGVDLSLCSSGRCLV